MVLNEQASAKWKPILEHEDLPQIADSYKKSVTAVLLENQERMMREQAAQRNGMGLFLTEDVGGGPMGSGIDVSGGDTLNSLAPVGATTSGAVQFVDPVLISLVRRTMPKLLAYDVCGVQPLTGPTGLIFAMRSHYGSPAELPTATDYTAGNNNITSEAFYGEANTAFTTNAAGGAHTSNDPVQGFFNGTATHGTGASTSYGENMGRTSAIPEMSFSIEKMSVTAQTRKLRGQYTLEMAQDLKATHGLNAESELSNILSNEILAEVNRQVIRTIYTVAKPGAKNATDGANSNYDLLVDSNGRWSVEKFKGLMFQMEVEANQIARETRRGKGNTIICSADVASALQMAGVLDYSSNLRVSLKSDETDNLFAGVLNGQFKVYIDPYLPINTTALVVVGYKGSSPYDSGVFYCPYQPLQMLRAQDPATFTPIIGFMSRDAMVANPFSAIDDSTGRPVRHDGTGLKENTNVYYRKFKVLNLT